LQSFKELFDRNEFKLKFIHSNSDESAENLQDLREQNNFMKDN